MPELDDAALERRLRGVLKEHLGALPLDLTVDALDRRREAKGRCPTIRPGSRHHAARGRSPAARRRGVGGGLRPSAAAVGRPARACSIGRCGRHGIAGCDVPEPERIGGTIRNPDPGRGPGGAWIPVGSMGTPRDGHDAVRLLDGRVLVLGGDDGSESGS